MSSEDYVEDSAVQAPGKLHSEVVAKAVLAAMGALDDPETPVPDDDLLEERLTEKQWFAMYQAQCEATDDWHARYDRLYRAMKPDGRVAELQAQLAQVNGRLADANAQLALLMSRQHLLLEQPALVGNTVFGKGVPKSLVIERAQREYSYRKGDKDVQEIAG